MTTSTMMSKLPCNDIIDHEIPPLSKKKSKVNIKPGMNDKGTEELR